MSLFDQILAARGLNTESAKVFLNPNYSRTHNPFLLPDMQLAVDRLVVANNKQEYITIYGDYDIDGLTATTVLLDGLKSFGFTQVDAFIPNRFVEGYGLTVDAVEQIAATGATLIITVDCGSLSQVEIARAGELGVDVIVTDHHNVSDERPVAVAVINPKRLSHDYPEKYEGFILKDSTAISSRPTDSRHDNFAASSLSSAELAGAQTTSTSQDKAAKLSGRTRGRSKTTAESPALYPFLDLAGVGVAFKLIQALQTVLPGLEKGQEKWLLDLVALGTVCDVVTLVDENRIFVYWGLKVLEGTRRAGLKALMAVAWVDTRKLNARTLGFALGPRMNAAGRLETAQYALDMLLADDTMVAFEKAQLLDAMNVSRRADQDVIFKMAIEQAEKLTDDPVLVVSHSDWNHGIVGIVAANLLEKYHKPTFVLQEMGEETKGSARSFGDFSAADAIHSADDLITKGGGHKLAAGITLPTKNIEAFRQRVNQFYRDQKLKNQAALLLPRADLVIKKLSDIDEQLVSEISQLEPFGNGNPQPIFKADKLLVVGKRQMGDKGQHVKLELQDSINNKMQFLAFSAPEHFFVEPGESVTIWFQPDTNEWQGQTSVEGRLVHLELD